MNMTVKMAKEQVAAIQEIKEKIHQFDVAHEGMLTETGFLCDAIIMLTEYETLLTREIDKAVLNIE